MQKRRPPKTALTQGKVVSIFAHEPLHPVLALCIPCHYRWLAFVNLKRVSLFSLECPECHHANSFASIVPPQLVEQLVPEG